MADTISKAYREDNSDATVKCWQLLYAIDNGAGKTNSFVVVVLASEMTDPTDASEAKTKANAKATVIKDNWITALTVATTQTNDATIEGAVTL